MPAPPRGSIPSSPSSSSPPSLCISLQVGQRPRAEQTCDPSAAANQDSGHVSHSCQNNCWVNEHTARRVTSRRALWISYTAAGGRIAQSRLMLIISHRVVTGADGGAPRTHLVGLPLSQAGGRGGRLIGNGGRRNRGFKYHSLTTAKTNMPIYQRRAAK